MDDIKLARVYAQAIFDIGIENDQIFSILEMLDVLLNHIKSDEEFKNFLTYPIIDSSVKKKIINILYKDIKLELKDVLDYLVDKERLVYIEQIRNEYLKIYYEQHNQLIVTAIFPCKITKEQEERLIKKLEKMNKKKILLNTRIDESLIAGGIIKINDHVIDGSMKAQIEQFRKAF